MKCGVSLPSHTSYPYPSTTNLHIEPPSPPTPIISYQSIPSLISQNTNTVLH